MHKYLINMAFASAAGLFAALPAGALAQAFPVKPIRVLIPQTPGAELPSATPEGSESGPRGCLRGRGPGSSGAD